MKKIFRNVWEWFDDRTGLSELVGPMARHLVPKDATWWYVFGSATLCAFMVQVVSGVALAFVYIPSSSQAYSTLQFITRDAPLGAFVRGLHYYGASAMVLMVGIHMAQVFLFGSYKYPREMNWLTGILLLGFTLVMGFTGQLLRWDQTAVWSVMVAAKQVENIPIIGHYLGQFIMGGNEVGGVTLTRFFAIHVFIIPPLVIAFVGLHMLLVLRHGISEPPKEGHPVDPKTYKKEYEKLMKKSGVPFWPDAVWRDMVFAIAMLAGIVLLALIFGPPQLGKPPDPSIVEAYPRPDWYLMWYFAVMALLPPNIEKYFMIIGPLFAGFLLIALPFISGKGERSPRRRPWSVAIIIMIVLMVGSLWVAGIHADWSPNFNVQPLSEEVVGTTSGPIAVGAKLFYAKGCLNCHLIQGEGGRRGPDLSLVGDKLTETQMILRISNGGTNMPSFAGNLTSEEMGELVAFLKSRKTSGFKP